MPRRSHGILPCRPLHSRNPKRHDELEAAVDQAISACGGDMRATIRALIVANEYLETEVGELMKAVSHAYARGRFQRLFGLNGRRQGARDGRYETVASVDFCCTTELLRRVPACQIAGEDPAQRLKQARTCSNEF